MNGKYVLTVPKLASSLVRSEDHLSPISPYRSLSIAPLTESLQRETSNLNKSNDDELITLPGTPVSGFIRPYLFRSASFSLLFSPIHRTALSDRCYRSLSANSTRREKKKQALKQDLIFFFSPQDSNSRTQYIYFFHSLPSHYHRGPFLSFLSRDHPPPSRSSVSRRHKRKKRRWRRCGCG